MRLNYLKENGLVLAIFDIPADYAGGVVLAKLDGKFVVWSFNAEGSLFWGKYFPVSEGSNGEAERAEAEEAFKKKVADNLPYGRLGVYELPKEA